MDRNRWSYENKLSGSAILGFLLVYFFLDSTSNPLTLTVGTRQEKDQAAGKERITLWENLRRGAEKSACQARKEEEQQSPYWGLRLAIPLPVTGPRRYTPSPSSQHKPTVQHTAPYSSSKPVLGAAHFLCPVRDSSTPPPQSSRLTSDSEFCRSCLCFPGSVDLGTGFKRVK
ncbi:hypothetical protein AMECASPLE_036545 [Ameca splendens]|uniref:Uncharacterized protein n=1 Tax=Ameca splendens TaxID=208324 RepID=A0ABV0YVG8_9TELE